MATAALDLHKCRREAVKAARMAGKLIRKAMRAPLSGVENKSAFDLVTDTDKKSEELVLGHLKRCFPDHKFIGEESAADNVVLTLDPTWMVDPLDGTTNFVHRVPYVAVSIGLTVNKQPVLGVVYAVMTDELFTAIKGDVRVKLRWLRHDLLPQGAYLNDVRIYTSKCEQMERALLATGFPKYRDQLPYHTSIIYTALRRNLQAVRANGSCAIDLCSIACGRLDLYIETGGICCWDVCAGAIILREAGGYLCDPSGSALDVMNHQCLAAASEALAQHMVKCVVDREAVPSIGVRPKL